MHWAMDWLHPLNLALFALALYILGRAHGIAYATRRIAAAVTPSAVPPRSRLWGPGDVQEPELMESGPVDWEQGREQAVAAGALLTIEGEDWIEVPARRIDRRTGEGC